MEQLFSVLIGTLVASILSVGYLHVSEKLKMRSEVLLEVVGFCDEIYHHLQNFHVYKNAEYTDRDHDLAIEDYRSLSRELTVLLTSTKVNEKMVTAFGEKEELGLFLELSNQLRQLARILHRATRNAGINTGQQVNQLFKDKIDPLRHKLLQNLIKGAKVTGILPDVYKYQMPTFYKITSYFIKPKT